MSSNVVSIYNAKSCNLVMQFSASLLIAYWHCIEYVDISAIVRRYQ